MKVRRALPTLIATCATICIMMPSVAHAANTTCANADFMFLGERAQYTIGASRSNLYFKTNVDGWTFLRGDGLGAVPGYRRGRRLRWASICSTTARAPHRFRVLTRATTSPIVFGIVGHSGGP